MAYVNVAAIATTAYGAYNTYKQSKNAGQQAQQSADPFGNQRALYQGPTMDIFQKLLNFSGEDLQNDPQYKSLVNSGIDTVNLGSAAQGRLRSGNRDVALQKVGMDSANQIMQQRWNQLFGLLGKAGEFSGATVNPGTGAALGFAGNNNATSAVNAGINGIFQGIKQGNWGAPSSPQPFSGPNLDPSNGGTYGPW